MPRSTKSPSIPARVSLKTLADFLDLSPATISFVLNNVPGRSIPQITRNRVHAAAKKFGYQPSFVARSLQGMKSQTIGVLLPVFGEGYHTQVLAGAGDSLIDKGYFFFTAHHRHREDLVLEYPNLMAARGIEGILAIDTHLKNSPQCPTVAIASHHALPGVTNVVLNHQRAAELALQHLYQLGHRKIAFMRGQNVSSDSDARWKATVKVARSMGLTVSSDLTVKLDQDLDTPELGYPGIRNLLRHTSNFTAMLCFNDVAAIGTLRALFDTGLRVPHDVSILGFDDIPAAAFNVPSISTIRQPLQEFGRTAAQLLLRKIAGERVPSIVTIEPELIVRESTGPAPKKSATARSHPGKK
jgi:DNA-binding LacI/PurR family transcriptional regulator